MITWMPPGVTDNIEKYVVYMSVDDYNTIREALWDKKGYFEVPMGTNQLDIWLDTAPWVVETSQLPNYIFIVVYDWLRGEMPIAFAGMIPLYDDSETEKPEFVELEIFFEDLDIREFVIAGLLTWEFAPDAAQTYTTHWNVYASASSTGQDKKHLGEVERGTNELEVSSAVVGRRSYIFVFATNPNGEATTASYVEYKDFRPLQSTSDIGRAEIKVSSL